MPLCPPQLFPLYSISEALQRLTNMSVTIAIIIINIISIPQLKNVPKRLLLLASVTTNILNIISGYHKNDFTCRMPKVLLFQHCTSGF